MKIPLIYIPNTKFKRFLYVEKSFSSLNTIIPLGCDCHPAYCLQKLHIRTQSFPFDWLNTKASKGICFVNDNIETGFTHFLDNLIVNGNGNVISNHYPDTEFIHEAHLIDNADSRLKIKRRIKRFQEVVNKNAVSFLYNIPVSQLMNNGDIEELLTSIRSFVSKLPEDSQLHVYLRYDEADDENQELSVTLFQALKTINKVRVVKYTRQFSKYGIWGDKSKYPDLLKRLGIPLQRTFPKIYIK